MPTQGVIRPYCMCTQVDRDIRLGYRVTICARVTEYTLLCRLLQTTTQCARSDSPIALGYDSFHPFGNIQIINFPGRKFVMPSRAARNFQIHQSRR